MAVAPMTYESPNSRVNDINANNGAYGSNSSGNLQFNFLQLMIAQLQNQDPTNPLQNNELTSQLAQISTVEGIEKLNKTLEIVGNQIFETEAVQARALIGHGVMVMGENILVGHNEDGEATATPIGVLLGGDANKVTVEIKDATGNVVRTIEIDEALSAGKAHSIEWDGLLTDGTHAPEGAYTFTVAAKMDGDKVEALSLSFGVVQGVRREFVGGIPYTMLDLGPLGSAPLRDVQSILGKMGSQEKPAEEQPEEPVPDPGETK